ncbi:hypothetical protein Rhopal_001112-T1 [Rhodotorula paludigena]|uniref:Myb-like domain-containing protein n=1 Tax=Rhodotorula paludigena TaxID=86838 RepID=A0AAV5GET0_9BASI|nr:hypothetical protein Rhopal_001112-T1 [Rhodotorula paludigena]
MHSPPAPSATQATRPDGAVDTSTFVNPSPARPAQHGSEDTGEAVQLSRDALIEIKCRLDRSEARATIARLQGELDIYPAFHASRVQFDQDRLASENSHLATQARVLADKLAVARAKVKSLERQLRQRARPPVGPDNSATRQENDVDADADDKTDVDADEDGEEEATEVDEPPELLEVQELRQEKRALTTDVEQLQDRVRLPSVPASSRYIDRAAVASSAPQLGIADEAPSARAAQFASLNPPNSAADLPKGKPRAVLLGDAEAELLLHAGKTLSHVNRINRIPLSSAIAEQAEDILRARAILPPLPDLPPLRHDGQHQPHKDWDGPFSLPLPPGLAHPDADVSRHPTAGPSSTRERESATLNDGFDGLLQLAQASSQEDLDDSSTLSPRAAKRRRVASVRHGDWTGEVDHGAQDDADMTLPIPPLSLQQAHAAHPYAPLPGPPSGRSRRGTLNVGDNDDPDYLPSPPPGLASTSSAGHGKGRQLGQRLSALDVLAQASASQEASQDDYDGLPLVPSTSGASASAGGKKKSAAARASQIEKKARSPYIKWNLQEDEMLLNAVIQCGCAWDSVAKLCPTRAYHQVRQRFLRGLRSGETIPPELIHLQPAVRKSVAEYEAKRKRKKLAKQAAEELHAAAARDD